MRKGDEQRGSVISTGGDEAVNGGGGAVGGMRLQTACRKSLPALIYSHDII